MLQNMKKKKLIIRGILALLVLAVGAGLWSQNPVSGRKPAHDSSTLGETPVGEEISRGHYLSGIADEKIVLVYKNGVAEDVFGGKVKNPSNTRVRFGLVKRFDFSDRSYNPFKTNGEYVLMTEEKAVRVGQKGKPQSFYTDNLTLVSGDRKTKLFGHDQQDGSFILGEFISPKKMLLFSGSKKDGVVERKLYEYSIEEGVHKLIFKDPRLNFSRDPGVSPNGHFTVLHLTVHPEDDAEVLGTMPADTWALFDLRSGRVLRYLSSEPDYWTLQNTDIEEIPETPGISSFVERFSNCTISSQPDFYLPFNCEASFVVSREGPMPYGDGCPAQPGPGNAGAYTPNSQSFTGYTCDRPGLSYSECDLDPGSSDTEGLCPMETCGHTRPAIDFGKNSAQNFDGKVRSVAAGDVNMVDDDPSWGNIVVIRHHSGCFTYYPHLVEGSVLVDIGDQVTQGQALGVMGNTGATDAYHIHFELRTRGYNVSSGSDSRYPIFSEYGGCTPRSAYRYESENCNNDSEPDCNNLTEPFNDSWDKASSAGNNAIPNEWDIDWDNDATETITSRLVYTSDERDRRDVYRLKFGTTDVGKVGFILRDLPNNCRIRLLDRNGGILTEVDEQNSDDEYVIPFYCNSKNGSTVCSHCKYLYLEIYGPNTHYDVCYDAVLVWNETSCEQFGGNFSDDRGTANTTLVVTPTNPCIGDLVSVIVSGIQSGDQVFVRYPTLSGQESVESDHVTFVMETAGWVYADVIPGDPCVHEPEQYAEYVSEGSCGPCSGRWVSVENAYVGPQPTAPGGQLWVSWSYRNTDGITIPAANIYLSDDAELDFTDTYLYYDPGAILQPFESWFGGDYITLPSNSGTGGKYILIEVFETDLQCPGQYEVSPLELYIGTPCLSANTATLSVTPDTIFSGTTSVWMTVSVTNTTDTYISGYPDELLFDGGLDVSFGGGGNSGILPGETGVFSFPYTHIDSILPPGTYWFHMKFLRLVCGQAETAINVPVVVQENISSVHTPVDTWLGEICDVDLYNMLGQLVYTTKSQIVAHEIGPRFGFLIENLSPPSGMYVLRISNQTKGVRTIKFQVVR